MSAAGWYPDPGGQSGLFRYWTGTAWTAAVTSDPSAPPPVGSAPPTHSAFGGYSGYGAHGSGYSGTGGGQASWGTQSGGYSGDDYATPTRKKSSAGLIVGLVAVIVAVVLIAWFAIPRVFNSGGGGGGTGQPGPGNPTAVMCPKVNDNQGSTNRVENGRVYGGKMSYPVLGSPWSTPKPGNKVPYGPDAYSQTVLDQAAYDGNPEHDWVSSVIVADLWNGDGFGSMQQAAELVLHCVMGTYYGNMAVTQTNTTGAPHSVSGHNGWLIDTTLTFSLPGLNATSERVLMLVVDTGPGTSGEGTYALYYSSVPNTSSQNQPDVEQALAALTVDG